MKIIFAFPYRGAGGVSTLFGRIHEDLCILYKERAEYFVLDYSDGFLSNIVSEENCIEYFDDKAVSVPDNSIIWFQSSTTFRLLRNLDGKNLRCVFWNLHPLNTMTNIPRITNYLVQNPFSILSSLVFKTTFYRNSLVVLPRYLIRNNGLYFMDIDNLSFARKFIGPIDEGLMLPVYFKNEKNEISVLSGKACENNSLEIIWIGRLCDFKYYPLKKFISDLTACKNYKGINLTIIGDGEFRTDLEVFSTSLADIRLSVKYMGEVSYAELKNFLQMNYFDFAVAMGTSVLEPINALIPTLIVDYEYKQIENNNYNWVRADNIMYIGMWRPFNTVKKYHDLNQALFDLPEVNEQIEVIQTAINEYYGESVLVKILNISANTRCKYEELQIQKFVSKYDWIYKLFNFFKK